jgi:hypothetical protein
MGWLARQDGYDPNAFDVPGEQSTGVGWANRMGEILHARRPDDPTVVATTASPLVTITEGDIGRATDAAMGVSGGGLSTKGIKAYHSSPHDFDKFDLAKIGTGEGAQVYGHGLYFAESPAVSGQGGEYWKQFQRKFSGDELAASIALKQSNFDREAAIAAARDDLDYMRQRQSGLVHPGANREGLAGMIAGAERELALLESRKPVGPRTYEVNINADPAHLLDWDKPLREQNKDVFNRFSDAAMPGRKSDPLLRELFGEGAIPSEYLGLFDKSSGAQAYKTLAAEGKGAPAFSQQLSEAGIPGIKYLDEGSRVIPGELAGIRKYYDSIKNRTDIEPEGIAATKARIDRLEAQPITSNYVIFDPNLIRIDKKYALPLAAAPAGMSALAAQDRYE